MPSLGGATGSLNSEPRRPRGRKRGGHAFALRRMTAGRLASLSYLIPVVAIVLGWALLGETPPALAVGGGALCVLGVYLARRR
jgi:uncharacterized membrane protein